MYIYNIYHLGMAFSRVPSRVIRGWVEIEAKAQCGFWGSHPGAAKDLVQASCPVC